MAKRARLNNKSRVEAGSEYLKTILDSMEDGIYIVGRDYRIEFMNSALQSMHGNGEGRLCYEFFGHHPSNCEHCQHQIGSFGPELRHEWHWQEAGRSYEIIVSPIHSPSGKISRLHILRDITERKKLETQLQQYSRRLETKLAEQAEELIQKERLALLGEISAGLAHEIRTPLGAIITGIRLLEKSHERRQDSDMIFSLLKRETNRLSRKVEEFLSYARPRLPQINQTCIAKLFTEIEAILSTDRELIGNVDIITEIKPPQLIWPLDADRMKEALLNICVNALQALQGKGTLRLEAKSYYEGILEILIRDTGPGIPHDALPHLFKPFFSRRSEGTGLGLAISKDIIEYHRGHIAVTSIPNLHTTFRITLRRATDRAVFP